MILKPYFLSIKRQEEFENELVSWIGTPYRANVAVKNRGVDCSCYIASVLYKLGVITGFDRPKYLPKNWFLFSGGREFFLENFEKNKKYLNKNLIVKEFDNEMLPGDWLMMKTGNSKQVNHSAIYFSDLKIYQSIEKSGVVCSPIDRWKKYIVKKYRLFEVI